MDNQLLSVDIEALKEFLTDIKCLDPIKNKAEKFNLFDVFGFARNEIRHSFVLKWLLDPRENHGLGDSVIKALIGYLVSAEPSRYSDRLLDLLIMDCSDFTVQREMKNIDLFLSSEKNSITVTIENKIDSREHSSTGFDSQLDKYYAYVEETFRNYKTKIYVYLTPGKESPSDEESWQSLSYSEIVEILEGVFEDNKDRLLPDVSMLIQNYIDILRRDIVEDTELNRICNEIYRKHRKALDLIYNHSDMGTNPTMRALTDVLEELANEGKVEYDVKDRHIFHTPVMTGFLPKLKDPVSSWGTQYTYNYWFKTEPERIAFVFEIGFWGIDEETRKKMDGFINTRNPRKKKETDRYKRVETTKWVDLTDLDDSERRNEIRKLVEEILKKEGNWISECENFIARG